MSHHLQPHFAIKEGNGKGQIGGYIFAPRTNGWLIPHPWIMDLLRTFTLSAWFGFHKAFREGKQPHASREVSTTTLAQGDTNRASLLNEKRNHHEESGAVEYHPISLVIIFKGITWSCHRAIGITIGRWRTFTKAPSQFTSLSWPRMMRR